MKWAVGYSIKGQDIDYIWGALVDVVWKGEYNKERSEAARKAIEVIMSDKNIDIDDPSTIEVHHAFPIITTSSASTVKE